MRRRDNLLGATGGSGRLPQPQGFSNTAAGRWPICRQAWADVAAGGSAQIAASARRAGLSDTMSQNMIDLELSAEALAAIGERWPPWKHSWAGCKAHPHSLSTNSNVPPAVDSDARTLTPAPCTDRLPVDRRKGSFASAVNFG